LCVVRHFEPTLVRLHQRVLEHDAHALEETAAMLMPLLCRRLQRGFPRVPDEWIIDGVEDAVLEYLWRPERYDVDRGVSLVTFLEIAARCNLIDVMRADERRRHREASYARTASTVVTPVDSLDRWQLRAAVSALLRTASNDREHAALRLWITGERRIEPLAAALGLSWTPPIDRQRAVKQFKDRCLKRATRGTAREKSQRT
jgi:hypothetical protein